MKTITMLKIGLVLSILIAAFVLIANWVVQSRSKPYIYNSAKEIATNKVGLLLGTRKTLSNGHQNLYFKYRIQAAVELFNAGKINYILVSGDNSRLAYDEPTDMKLELMAAGVPENKIVLDYAGFRTLDSVVRAKEVFGQSDFTVISQPFHNERAVFIAQQKGIKALGFNAKDVPNGYGTKTMIREKFARSKMVLDLLFGKAPKFLGEKIAIN